MEEFIYIIADCFYILCLFTGFFVIFFMLVQGILDGLVWLSDLEDKLRRRKK